MKKLKLKLKTETIVLDLERVRGGDIGSAHCHTGPASLCLCPERGPQI